MLTAICGAAVSGAENREKKGTGNPGRTGGQPAGNPRTANCEKKQARENRKEKPEDCNPRENGCKKKPKVATREKTGAKKPKVADCKKDGCENRGKNECANPGETGGQVGAEKSS